jgi:anaerobic selenocysteine-containing dehydrogenase
MMASSQPALRTERSYCRICTSQCGILVDLDGEQVVRIRGDKEHPISRGYTCPKGRALGQMHHHPQRIERPMIRTNDILEPTSWDHLLDDLAGKLRRIIDTHGPASVGIFFGSGNGMDAAGYRMAEVLHGAIGTPAKFSPLTIDGTAKTYVGSVVAGFPGFSPRPDYERLKLMIYIGINPLISHGHTVAMPNPALTVKAIARQGEVWVIDPRRNDTAAFATSHMAPRPGTDYAILAYLVREVLRSGASADALARSIGVEELRAAVEPFDRARAATISGVPEEELDQLLASVRKAGRLAIETGTGVTMSRGANLTQWLAWTLMIITDSMNRPGGVWFHNGFLAPLDMAPLPIIDAPFGPGPATRPDLRSLVGDWPCAVVPAEIEAGNIRAFLNLGGAMIRSFPEANALRKALPKLEVFATMEIIENENTELSTHVLPTKDQLERADISLWDFVSPRVSAQYTPRMVEPVGDRKSSWWVLSQLTRRLGYDLPAPVPDDDADASDQAMLAAQMAYARCSFDALTASGYAEVDHGVPGQWVDEHIARFGGWRLAPQELVDHLVEVSEEQLAAASEGKILRLIPRRQRRHLNAAFLFLGDSADVLLHPDDALAAGIQDGEPVAIRSSRGEIVGTARIDPTIRRGVVSVPHGHREANVNELTDAAKVDRLTGMVLYSGFEVSIHPLPLAAE